MSYLRFFRTRFEYGTYLTEQVWFCKVLAALCAVILRQCLARSTFEFRHNCYAPKKRNLCGADIIAERNVPKARRSGAIVRWLSTGCLHARNRYAQAQTVKLNIFQKIVLFELLTIVFVSRQKIGNIIPKIFVVGRNIKMRERMRNKISAQIQRQLRYSVIHAQYTLRSEWALYPTFGNILKLYFRRTQRRAWAEGRYFACNRSEERRVGKECM